MKVFNWMKRKPVKTIAAVSAALAMTLTASPAVAQTGSGVSGAFMGPISGSANGGNQSRGELGLVSFQSGSWKIDPSNANATSPAWDAFARDIRVDREEVNPGDVAKTFEYLAAGGIDQQACMKSSAIWVVQDKQYRGVTTNIHMSWPVGTMISNNPTSIKNALISAPVIAGTQPINNIATMAEEISQHQVIKNQDFGDLKVLCSYQFSNEPNVDNLPDYTECIGEACETTTKTPSPEAQPKLCNETNWTSPTDDIWNRYAGIQELSSFLMAEGGEGMRLGLSGIGSTWISNLNSISGNTGEPGRVRDIRVAWRCNTRYMVHYQTAPATYLTKTSLAQVVSPVDSKVYNNTFDAVTKAPGYAFKTNSAIANAWHTSMKFLSPANIAPTESNLTITDFGKVWNEAENRPANNKFDSFYQLSDNIDAAVSHDERGVNYSSGVDLSIPQRGVLASGGILNVQELERQKLVRVVQPYVELQLAKCSKEEWVVVNPMDQCNPIPSGHVDNYDNEKVDVTLTNPTKITADQARYLINRSINLAKDITSGATGSAAIEGFTRIQDVMQGDVQNKMQKCSVEVRSRVMDSAEDISDFNLGNSGDIFNAAVNIYNIFNSTSTMINNITLPCQSVLEVGNPTKTNRIVGDIANFAGDLEFFNNPNRKYYATAYIPAETDVIVQKAQFDPETVSWWQAISVNCNQSGFQQLIAQTGAEIISDDIPGIGDAFHGVAKSPVVQVDYTKPETKYKNENYFFGKAGTASSFTNFYDKECPFNCISSSNPIFGANANNDAINNTPDGNAGNGLGYGAQVRDSGNSNTYNDGGKNELSNTDFVNIFRDNIKNRIRIDVWYPTNSIGQIVSQGQELSNKLNGGNIASFLEGAEGVMDTAELHNEGGSTFGVFYDGSVPSSTTITRFEGGTPTIGDFFKVWAVTSRDNQVKLEAGTGDTKEIFKKGTNAEIPTQKSLSHDVNSVGSETAAILPNFVNTIDVASSWASEKSRPQAFNFKWEYQVPTIFFGISSAGFDRNDGTLDTSIIATSKLSLMFTILEGKCYSMFGTELGKNTIGLFGNNTGTGSNNRLDNNPTGLVSNNPSDESPENLLINSLRATTE